jgi:hypothetical protein
MMPSYLPDSLINLTLNFSFFDGLHSVRITYRYNKSLCKSWWHDAKLNSSYEAVPRQCTERIVDLVGCGEYQITGKGTTPNTQS